MKSKGKLIFVSTIVVLALVGIIWGVKKYIDWSAEKEEYKKKQERQAKIEKSLYDLGSYNRTFGGQSIHTVNYSMALDFLKGAVIEDYDGNYKTSGYDGTKKEYYLSKLEMYDEELRIAVMLFGYDYLNKDDVEDLVSGGVVSDSWLKEEFINVMTSYQVGFNSFLISSEDAEILNNISLRIRLAEDGYISIDQIKDELYGFVYREEEISVVDHKLLEKGVEYEDIAQNIADSFCGREVMFNDLTNIGQLVFLYMTPQFLAQCSEYGNNIGQILWMDSYSGTFDQIWEKIIEDNIFEGIISD